MNATSSPVTAALLALPLALLGGCHTPAKGYREVPDSELPRHAPTGMTFPATAGTLQRQWFHEKIDDPRSIRVGYGLAAWLEVAPSGGSASTKLKAMVRSLLERDLAVAVTHRDPREGELFPGWKTAVLKNSAPLTDARRDPDDRPRRNFVAARRCGRYMLSARAWSVDPKNTEQLRQLAEAMREIFADACKQRS